MRNERHFSTRGSWLVADEADRGRMLDMDQRLAPIRRRALAVLGLGLVASGPWFGWWPLLPLGVAAVAFAVAERLTRRLAKPEYGIFAAWVMTQVAIAAAVALSDGPVGVAMAWMALPVVTLSARFSMQGVAWGVAITLGLMIAVSFGVHADRITNDPPLLIMPVTLVIGLAMLSTALMRSDMEHRSEAVVDPLTGMLNRKALAARIAELSQQSQVSGEPIGVIVGDVDNFKRINDSHGHSTGDAVLRDVASVLRRQLRAFDLVYRLGGEEFLILLPGSDVDGSESRAEQLRLAVADGSMAAGAKLTMSFGVSASTPGAEFDYDAVFAAADAALYEAKRRGRDQVVAGREGTRAGRLASRVWGEGLWSCWRASRWAAACSRSAVRAPTPTRGAPRPAPRACASGEPPASRRAGRSRQATSAPRGTRAAFEAGYAAGANDVFGGFDGGWSLGTPYVITLRKGSGAITYRIDSRRLVRGTSTP